MPRITKNTLLNYIPNSFEIETTVNPARVFDVNNKSIKSGDILYLCEREIRAKDNFALQFALQKSKELNASQIQLMREGTIHGYLRIYWAKKILEWTDSCEESLEIAIYLNDKYAYDSPSANGYVGILWSIGALHYRAFVDYPVTGKVHKMTYDAMRRKVDLKKYISQYVPE